MLEIKLCACILTGTSWFLILSQLFLNFISPTIELFGEFEQFVSFTPDLSQPKKMKAISAYK